MSTNAPLPISVILFALKYNSSTFTRPARDPSGTDTIAFSPNSIVSIDAGIPVGMLVRPASEHRNRVPLLMAQPSKATASSTVMLATLVRRVKVVVAIEASSTHLDRLILHPAMASFFLHRCAPRSAGLLWTN
jgi:hypothetical protein